MFLPSFIILFYTLLSLCLADQTNVATPGAKYVIGQPSV